jgi:DNA-binding beta-propeller fold protein YncE
MLLRVHHFLAAALFFTLAYVQAANASGLVLVMNSGEASLSVVDMDAHRELSRIPVLREPHHWALTPDGRDLLVGDTAGNALFDLDPTTFAVRRRVPVSDPYQLGFSPDGRFLTVNGNGRNQVDIYDGATLKLIKRFPLRRTPSHLDYAPDSSRVFVSLQDTDQLAAIDLRSMTVAWDAVVGKVPAGVLWLNGRVLVALMNDEGLVVVDPATGHVERRVHTGAGAHQLFLSPDKKILWVNNRVAGTTVALDPSTLTEIRSYRITGGPDDIAFAPDGKLWITQRFARSLAILDPASGQIETIAVGRQPHGIFLNPNATAAALSASN